TNREQQTIGIALKYPRRRIADEFLRQHADNHRDIISRLKSLQAVQQHWFAGDPTELFELGGCRPGSATSRYDDDADIAHHWVGGGRREAGSGNGKVQLRKRGTSVFAPPASRFPPPALCIEQLPEEITNGPNTDDFDTTRALFRNAALRHVRRRHSHLGRLSQSPL